MPNPDTHQHLQEFIKNLTAAVSFRQLYFSEHPQVMETVENAFRALSHLVKPQTPLTLTCIGQILLLNNVRITKAGPSADRLIQLFQNRSVDGISFQAGISRQEIHDLVTQLASGEKSGIIGSRHVNAGKLVAEEQAESITDIPEFEGVLDLSGPFPVDDLPDLPDSPELERLRTAFEELKNKPGQKEIQGLTTSVELFMKGFSRSIHPMLYLGSLKSFDEYTFVHAINVFMLTTSQAQYIGFKGKQLYDIGVASVLHDVGKLFISDDIINKPGALTPEERTVMQTHSLKGARYLMEMEGISRLAPICAMDHHIRFDGSGYPRLKRWRPNIVSQMITIADAFDAMRSRRPYQEPKPQELVIKILRGESGTAFNPALVTNFLTLLGRTLLSLHPA